MSDGQMRPVKIVRPPRTLRVIYCDGGREWRALSPDVRRLSEHGATLDEVRDKTRARLQAWLGPDVRIEEQVDEGKLKVSHATPGVVHFDDGRALSYTIFTSYAATEATPRGTVEVELHRTRVNA